MRIGSVALMALAMVGTANAESDSGSAFRIGIGGGKAKFEMDKGFRDSTTALEVFGGWELNRYLAAEAGYLASGKAKDAGVTFDTSAAFASVLGSLWFNEDSNIYARVGVLHWKNEVTRNIPGFVTAKGSFDGNDLYYGIGVAGLLDGALLRLEYRMTKLDDVDLSMTAVTLAWRF
jgi:hypothetical protein